MGQLNINFNFCLLVYDDQKKHKFTNDNNGINSKTRKNIMPGNF